jgi:glycine cleavage system H protein
MDEKKTISKVIPEGELKCIWAEAGMVSYKLCDRNFECDECPFDRVIRQKSLPGHAPPVTVKRKQGAAKETVREHPKQETLLDLIRTIFNSPFSDHPPSDRSYSRGHVWMKEVSPNTWRIGVDHYAAGLLEDVGSVVFPQTGTSVVSENPCAWIIADSGTIAVQSPMNGRVRGVNPRLMESAALVQSDPYESGWLNEIFTEGVGQAGSFDSPAAESMARDQFRKLKEEILVEFDNRPPTLGVTLMDGGVRPRSLKDILGPKEYLSILEKLLSNKL